MQISSLTACASPCNLTHVWCFLMAVAPALEVSFFFLFWTMSLSWECSSGSGRAGRSCRKVLSAEGVPVLRPHIPAPPSILSQRCLCGLEGEQEIVPSSLLVCLLDPLGPCWALAPYSRADSHPASLARELLQPPWSAPAAPAGPGSSGTLWATPARWLLLPLCSPDPAGLGILSARQKKAAVVILHELQRQTYLTWHPEWPF